MATPEAGDAGTVPAVNEDASDDATPAPADDADISIMVDASSLDAGAATVLAAGGQETCAVTSAGAVWCWGSNVDGQLGTVSGSWLTVPGSTEEITAATVPVQVTSAGAQAVAIAVGDTHACALSSGGGVQCWGGDTYGQLGRAGITTTLIPVSVPGLANVKAIAAGGYHTCALADGTVTCWGDDADGQLGNGATTSSSATPVKVEGLSGVTAIAAGGAHTCALTGAGGVECWGFNAYGQLGNGTTTSSAAPVTVSGLASGVTAIATGNSHTCALTSAGGVMCWGWGFYGQLGDGSTQSSSVPVAVSGLPPSIAIATGGTHSCALAQSGSVSCWGNDQSGQLGNNQSVDSNLPVAVTGLSPGAIGLTAGTAHTCALLDGGAAQCWGWNVAGQLGCDTNADSPTPVAVCGL
jgi:alpha-tubulin suppressor-like RCC1 family protein